MTASIIIVALIGCVVFGMLGVYLFMAYNDRKNKAWLNRRENNAKMSVSLKKYPLLYKLQSKIAYKLAITNTATRQENEQYAIYVIVFITMFALALMILWSQVIPNFWLPYFFILLLLISITIPWMLFSLYYDAQLAKMIKQLPRAIDEFASSYRKSNKVFHALKDSYAYMHKVIGKEFERLYKSYNTDFEDAIDFFRERVKNDWAGIFASLLMINHEQGGSIITQLDDLNTEIENDIVAKDRTRSKMLGFKLMGLGSLLLVVAAVFANMLMSEGAKAYYMNVAGQNEIILTLAVAFVTYLLMLLIEKL